MKHNWEYKKLGEVFETVTDFVAAGSFADLRDNVKYMDEKDFAQLIRTTDLKNNFKNSNFVYVNESAFNYLWRVNLNQECIILPNIGNCGEIYYLHPSMLKYQNNVLGPNAILIKSNKRNHKFFSYALKGNYFQSQLFKIISQVAQSKFNKTNLKKLELPIPPKEVQERIVSELDEINGMIEGRKEQIKLLDHLAQSIFYEMFGDPITNPKGWEVKKFGVIGEFQRGGGFLKSDFISDGVPCIHYGQIHMKFGLVVKGNLTFISSEIAKKSKFAKFNDVIIAITSEDLDGSCKSIAWLGNYDVAVGSHAAIFSHKQNAIFITYYMRTKAFNLDKERYAHGSKVVEIKPSDISKIPIFLPPISLQNEFASRIEIIEEQKKDIENSIKELETLLASRMDYWFN
ncbi:MAG: restriction endonuclease subunit S [Muribaculaceae bacterium]|nr:restriction endonuclease subunit S [Muribaculaceae bacterium]